MQYNALLTIDLPHSAGKKRDSFYRSLEKNKWEKIAFLSTAWSRSFQAIREQQDVEKRIIQHLKEAKKDSGLIVVSVAFQIGTEEVRKTGFML
ncbi:hypothetical protein [Leptospira licerasiae]|uniref:hypothetical protein n=1 Tax=Leptospira licerasiae TaxID=447106 RepID=UPI00301A326A